MDLPRCFIGNFEFEHTLADERFSLPLKLARLNAELACSLLPLMQDGDLLWLPEPIEDSFFSELESDGFPRVIPVTDRAQIPQGTQLVPWGWSAELFRWQHALGGPLPDVSEEAIRFANSRGTAFQLEQDLGVALPHASRITSVENFSRAITHLLLETDRWVLKAEFSMSARERWLGVNEPTEQCVNWIRKRLRTQGVVYLEPWLDAVQEAGVQWVIHSNQEVELVGVVPLLTDEQGQYIGSSIPHENTLQNEWGIAIETGRQMADQLVERGYIGPLGIDAMRYQYTDGVMAGERVRPLQDVNARLTMGRCALGWKRFAMPGESITWRHFIWPGDSIEEHESHWQRWVESCPETARTFRTSPLWIGNRVASRGQALIFHQEPILESAMVFGRDIA